MIQPWFVALIAHSTLVKSFKRLPNKMVKHGDELFDCVWPFGGVGAQSFKVQQISFWFFSLSFGVNLLAVNHFYPMSPFVFHWKQQKTKSIRKTFFLVSLRGSKEHIGEKWVNLNTYNIQFNIFHLISTATPHTVKTILL